MIWCLAMALGGAPEGVDPDDLDRWEGLAERAMSGPEGCWDFTGDLAVTTAIHSRAALWSRAEEDPSARKGTWSGRLDDGEWVRFSYRVADLEGVATEVSVYPVIGKIDPAIVDSGVIAEPESEKKGRSVSFGKKKEEDTDDAKDSSKEGPFNLLRKAIDGWESRTAFSNATWSDSLGAVRLMQQVPIDDTANAKLITTTTIFPDGGDRLSRMATVFPRRLTFGTWPLQAKVYDAQFHLVQQTLGGRTFPAAENMSAVGSALGFSLSYEQRLDYRTAQRCSSEP